MAAASTDRRSSIVGDVASFEQLHALYVLTDVLSRATEARAIYEAALDALARTVSPDRASVLVFDDDGVMRFRAQRGLSEAYRAAVEGHSPWKVDEQSPETITIDDVREEPSLATLRPVIEGEGIRALAFIPLVYQQKLLGKFMVYYDQPHHFARQELLLVETVARHVAFAIARKRSEERLELYRQIFERSIDGIAIVDGEGVYLEQNGAHESLLGFSDADLAGKTPAIHFGDVAFTEVVKELAERGRSRRRLMSTTKTGEKLDVELSAFAVKGAQTGTTRYVGIKRNVTHEENARRELRRALDERQEFLSIASHELKTPVTALALQLDALTRLASRQELAREELLERLAPPRRQVTKIVRLIETLLDLSRIEAGRIRVDHELVDVAALVRESAERFREEATRAGSELTIHAPTPIHTLSDAQRLDQIVTNLVSNAVKYGAGSAIEVSVREEGDRVRICVRDRGIGIAPEDHARVFERFERAASERRYGGFGLGLFIAREIAQALGGRISLESAPGVGSTFTVDLPKDAGSS